MINDKLSKARNLLIQLFNLFNNHMCVWGYGTKSMKGMVWVLGYRVKYGLKGGKDFSARLNNIK